MESNGGLSGIMRGQAEHRAGPHMGSTVTILFVVMQLAQDHPAAKWQREGIPRAAPAYGNTLSTSPSDLFTSKGRTCLSPRA